MLKHWLHKLPHLSRIRTLFLRKLAYQNKRAFFLLTIIALIVIYYIVRAILGHFMGGPPAFPTLVDTTQVKVVQWQPEINTTGSLHASQGITIKAETTGRITQVFFESGQTVKAGDMLVQINPDVLNAAYASDAAKLELSKLDYQRKKELYDKKVLSKADLDTALAQFNSDQANANKTKAQLEQTSIRAPFAGRLGLRQVELGEYLSPGQAVVTLEATNPMRVDFTIPETYLSQLKVAQTVVVRSRSYPGENFIGQVYAYDAVINPTTRSIGVEARIANPANKLVPGTFVEIALRVGDEQPTIAIPETAIVYDENGNYVYRIVDQKAIKTFVTLGAMRGSDVAVTNGLQEGDTVVTAGQLKLSDGALVADRANLPKKPS